MSDSGVSRRRFIRGTVSMAGGSIVSRAVASSWEDATAASTGRIHRASWMGEPRYCWGVMTHYLSDRQPRDRKIAVTPSVWNKLIDAFDVEAVSKQLESVGAGHYQLSIGQNSGYYVSPNAAYDAITGNQPSKCSDRDLIADFCDSLRKHDIKMMAYLPSGAPDQDNAAIRALEWRSGPYRNREFQLKWERVIAEWSRRWGKKLAGWWFDGCDYADAMYRVADAPNFASFAAAARSGNPKACVGFSTGVVYRIAPMGPDDDYTAGEIDKPEKVILTQSDSGRVNGARLHMLSFLGEYWGVGKPRFTDEQVIAYTRRFRDAGGSVTWDVPTELDGRLAEPFVGQLKALGRALPRR